MHVSTAGRERRPFFSSAGYSKCCRRTLETPYFRGFDCTLHFRARNADTGPRNHDISVRLACAWTLATRCISTMEPTITLAWRSGRLSSFEVSTRRMRSTSHEGRFFARGFSFLVSGFDVGIVGVGIVRVADKRCFVFRANSVVANRWAVYGISWMDLVLPVWEDSGAAGYLPAEMGERGKTLSHCVMQAYDVSPLFLRRIAS